MNNDAKQKITRARASLILDQPFYGALSLRMPLIEKSDIKTVATDGRRFFYNPTFITSIPIGQVKAEIAHEIMHCVYDHPGRRHGRPMKKWNIACDHAINPDLKTQGFELGKDWLLDMQYQGMSADHIYSLLPDDDDGGDGDGGPDDIKDPDDAPLSPEEKRDWQVAVAQAAQQAKEAGKLSKEMEKFLDAVTTPKVDWKTLLRQFLLQAAKQDYCWTRPNKMMQQYGLVLPTLYSEAMGEIAVFKDISCSIDHATTSAFSTEIKAIIEDLAPEKTHVLYVDTQVQRHDIHEPTDFDQLDNFIGGGTDFRPPFEKFERDGITPMCAIYLTDLEGPFPAAEPDYPVLWCTINDLVAPFGQTVKIEV